MAGARISKVTPRYARYMSNPSAIRTATRSSMSMAPYEGGPEAPEIEPRRLRPGSGRFGIPRVVGIADEVLAERPPVRQPLLRNRLTLFAKLREMGGTAVELGGVLEAPGSVASHLDRPDIDDLASVQ